MLTALTKTGKKICLGYDYQKETLVSFRRQEEFLCPICGEEVILKLGEQRIFHFAHKQGGNCRDFYEHESFSHMEGKRQLYQWLIKQRIPSVLEFYDPEIGQRPDIMFKYNGKKYALEFQCSTIAEGVFTKRTNTYLENAYIPLWIISSSHIHQQKKDIISLSNFHYLFLRSSSSLNVYIPAYCPDKQLFQFVESPNSCSIKKAFAKHSFYSPKQLKLNDLLEPEHKHELNLAGWSSEMEKFILNFTIHQGKAHKGFLREIYNRNLNPFLLPPEIGLPVPHSFLIQTAPLIWQTYLFLDILANKNPNDVITLKEIKAHLKKRISRNEITIRNLPQIKLDPVFAILEYFQYLGKLGILTRNKDDSFYQVKRKIFIPKSNREKEEAKQRFYQNNK